MDELGKLMHGVGVALTLPNIGFMFIGILLAVLIGVLPGLGGAITSILFNIPGEPWSVATTFDGYPMAQQGQAAQALPAAVTSSFIDTGLQPGPMLFIEQKDFEWGLIASMYLGNIVGLIGVLTTVPFWAAILRTPFAVIAPVIIVVCAIGAYTVHSSMFDVVLMMVFGVVGYFFKKLRYPLAPMVLALVLGDMDEARFRQAMLLSQDGLSIFWVNPLVGTITALAIALLLWPLWGAAKNIATAREGATSGA